MTEKFLLNKGDILVLKGVVLPVLLVYFVNGKMLFANIMIYNLKHYLIAQM